MRAILDKKRDFIAILFIILSLCLNFIEIKADETNNEEINSSIKICPVNKPVFVVSKNSCSLEYCIDEQYTNNKCIVTNPNVKTQFLGEFLYATENGSPIYSSFGRNSDGDIYFESSLGNPYGQKKIFTLKSDGREYIDGLRRNVINMDSSLYSTDGIGAIVEINSHKCYLKLSNYEALEMYDFDDKKFTSAKLEDIFGYKVESSKNSLIITNTANTFIYAYITTDNYLIMQKFKVVSNVASNCIQIIKTLKENVKTVPNNSRSCMITKKQYVECLDIDENQMYVIRVYDSNLNFLKQFDLEKNNAPAEEAGLLYHETVWLKEEISIFIYYTDTSENDAKPIMVLKRLTVSSKTVALNNLNSYLKRDVVYGNVDYSFSDKENSLAIFNEYYFGLSSFTLDKKHLIVSLFNIFNDDKTIDTHYFDIPMKELYNIEYQSGLQAFGYKNAYGVQMNYIKDSQHHSGFIVFGYANSTDPEPVNKLFDKYTSYTIKVSDYYTGIQNNIFCYVFVNLVITKIPNKSYFYVKNKAGRILSVNSKISLDEELTITKISTRTTIPKGRYVLGIAPYLNEADYDAFTNCSIKREMFGEQIPTDWYPDEYYGRTIEFKFTADIDCFENCDTCTSKGLTLDNQQCDTCKYGFYFVENTNNCYGEPPDGYYFDRDKKIYSKCHDNCKICTIPSNGDIQNCLSCKENYLFYKHTNCLDCKYRNKYVNYEQTECIDSIPDGYYVNDTEYNTIDKCHNDCLTCKGSSTEGNMNCLTCDKAKGLYLLENTNNCVKESYPGYYINEDTLRKCHSSCLTCSSTPIFNEYGEVTNCDTCNSDLGFDPIENTKTCTNGTRADIIFNDNCKCYKKCYKDCLTCSDKEIDQYHMNCLSCDESKGYIYFTHTNNCLNCKSQGKYINYEQTECIDSVPDGFYVNDTEINTIDKCHKNCLTCSGGSNNDEDMKCLSCDNSNKYYIVENTNNCQKVPYPSYYLDENTFKKCYKDCLTCSGKEVINQNGKIINMNCDSCDESKGLFLENDKNNCIDKNKQNEEENEDKCPKDKPILKNNNCTSEFCTEEEYEYKICKISNNIIKTQWIGDYPYVNHPEIPIYSTLGKSVNGDIFFESNLANPQSVRNVYTLKENGRGYIDEEPGKTINLNSNLNSKDGNGAIVNINGHKCYLRLSYSETIEVYDFDENKHTTAKLKDILGYEIKSSKNSLLRTKEENTFIYAYLTNNNYLIMQKFKIISNEASNCIQIIKTLKENVKSIDKNSRRCFITSNQYVECFDITENKIYVIRIYDSNLNFLNQQQLEQNNAEYNKIKEIYHEAAYLKDEIGIFIYFTSTSDKKAKPVLLLRKLDENGKIKIINSLTKYNIFESIPYTFSDTENSVAVINDHYFALASITEENENINKHLVISLFNLVNDNKSINTHYFVVPIKDLYNIDYISGLQSFSYKNAFGIQFNHKKDNEFRTGFIVFGYGNTTDPMYKNNIFESHDSYTFKPVDYIKIENNVFCYVLVNIQITELPDTSTGIRVLKVSNSEQLKVGDYLSVDDEIKITYTGDKKDIPKGTFIVGFVPLLKETGNDNLNECSSSTDIFGEQVSDISTSDEYYGRTAHFEFSVYECFKNCKDCDEKGLTIDEQKCKSCIKGYYLVENTQNCFKNPPDGYYFNKDKEIFSKCYDYCLKCSEGPITNKKGEIINMNCDSCDESKGFYLILGTKNCEDKNKIYDTDNCPVEKPISKNNNCVLEHCTEEEYKKEICKISNSIIKTQWIGDFPYVSAIDEPLYSTFSQISNDEAFFESNIGNPSTDRKIYILEEDGRGYFDGIPNQIIDLNSSYFSTDGNAARVNINGHKCYLRLSYHETIEMYDFDENKHTNAKLEDILGFKIKSSKNSLLRTKEENTFIYAYLTNSNYMIMQKFKVVSNDASNCIQIIKTLFETGNQSMNKNSRRCLITVNQFIECLDLDENQMYIIRIYDSNLNYLKQYELEKNKAPADRAYYTYHEAVWLKEEIGIFVYFNDISDNNAKPIFILKKLNINNNVVNLEDISSYLSAEKLYTSLPYKISDTENSLTIINDHYFALASLTLYENSHLLITLLNLFNDDKTIYANYFDIPIKDLYDIDYYSNLQSFGYRNGLGVQFNHKKGKEYRTGFILFGYGNSTDPTPLNDIFNTDESYSFKPLDYIKIENNIFCYEFVNIVITDIPDTSTGIKVLKASNSEQLKIRDVLSLDDEINITYTGNKDDIPRGKFIVGFKPYLKEPDEDKFYECITDLEIFGENVPKTWNPDEYYGRTAHFEFTIGECFKNCKTCITKGSNSDDQKCEACLDNYYFVEGTKNCFKQAPEGYYLNEEKEVYSKCYDKCKTCSKINNGKNHNCLTCPNKYLLYNNTNCLDCKYNNKYVNYEQTECIDSIPNGYYVNDTEYNTIDKCHKNCLTCNKAALDDNNMNCLTCDNANKFYKVENTNNCQKNPYQGYYLDGDTIKKCHIACASCSSKAILNENGEVTNCDICNKDLGFYQIDDTKVCRNTTKEGEYFDEECKCYKKCYKDCLTCSGKEIDQYHMNCLTCDESKGYTYFSKSTNCLNCKSQGKIVNTEQTECIENNQQNSEENLMPPLCYEKCSTCSDSGDETQMNCLTCRAGFYLKNGNCIKTYTCPYKFFYQSKIDQNADINQKICLDENEMCPCALPFYYPSSNECVEICPLELLLYQGCKISSLSNGVSRLISLVKLYFSQGRINYLMKSFFLNDINYLYELLVKISVYSLFNSNKLFRNLEEVDNAYRILNNDNITSINEDNSYNDSEVDLGSCENKLREYYNIPDDVQLTIIKLDLKKNGSTINNVQYEVFNPNNRSSKLDLTICKEEKVIIKNPIDSSLSLSRISHIMELYDNSDIFSEDNQFFKDECSIFTSEDKTDVLIQDRYNEYNYKNKVCQNGCELKKINITTREAFCSCQTNQRFIDFNLNNIEEFFNETNTKSYLENNEQVIYQKYSAFNGKIVKCAKNIGINFFKNYIIIIFTLFLLLYISLSIIIIIKNKFSKVTRNISNPPKSMPDIQSNEKLQPKNESKNKNKKKYEINSKIRQTIQEQIKIPNSTDKLKLFKKHNKQNEINISEKEIDIDSVNYLRALNKDKRNIYEIILSSLKERIIILSFIKYRGINMIKILIIIYAILNYIVTNAFFFTEKNIHQIYLDKGKYNFKYQIKYIISATLISSIFIYIAKLFTGVNKIVTKITNQKILKISIHIFICISNCLSIFYWIYLGSLTSTYINAKLHLFLNAFITSLFSCILECLLALISSILRYLSIEFGINTLYNISRIINYI